MPSAEETTYLIEMVPERAQDSFTSQDVDALVSRIKENLRLSGLKSRSSLAAAHKSLRASPYKLPTCELCSGCTSKSNPELAHKPNQQQQHRRGCKKAIELDDSYERFQALLRNGALIKEAVKRLQSCDALDDSELSENDSCTQRSDDDELDEHMFAGMAGRKRRCFYYDDDEDVAVFNQPLQL